MIGMPRSGTSVLSEAVSIHEDLGWFSNYLNRFPSIPWVAVLNRLSSNPLFELKLRGKKKQNTGLASLVRRYLPYNAEAYGVWEYCVGAKFSWTYLVNEVASEEEKKRVQDYVCRIILFQNKERLFSKLTGPPRICYLSSIFPNARFIHIIRDPRAVVSSLLKVNFWRNRGLDKPYWENGLPEEYAKEWRENDGSPAALAAVQWKFVVELTDHERESINDDAFLEMRYEDFVNNPHASLTSIFQFLRLPDSKLAHGYISSVGRLQNMNYKFKTNLTAREIESIERITESTAWNKGYRF